MALLVFPRPPLFPSPLIESYRYSFKKPWEEFQTDALKRRRRILSNTFKEISFDVLCTHVQVERLEQFIEDVNGGASSFNWYDPKNVLCEVVFAELPKISHLASVAPRKEWSVSISLEQSK